jgi:hypothetical protein
VRLTASCCASRRASLGNGIFPRLCQTPVAPDPPAVHEGSSAKGAGRRRRVIGEMIELLLGSRTPGRYGRVTMGMSARVTRRTARGRSADQTRGSTDVPSVSRRPRHTSAMPSCSLPGVARIAQWPPDYLAGISNQRGQEGGIIHAFLAAHTSVEFELKRNATRRTVHPIVKHPGAPGPRKRSPGAGAGVPAPGRPGVPGGP